MQTIEELQEKNLQLKKELLEKTKENSLQEDIVIQQSKMATMGEMIGNIAHQWRQPLMEVSTLLMNMEAKIKLQNSISNDEILDTIDKSNDVLKYMSHTIDDFRNFFATNKDKESFLVAEQIELAVNMMRSAIVSNNIKVNIVIKNNTKVYGCKNEYLQVLINILSNAKDILISKAIEKPTITIKLYSKSKYSVLEIEDNAGGIEKEAINKVFEPFFTHKKKNGTGIGLFMSKLIIENNMNGRLNVENKSNGASFRIIV